MSLRSSAGSFFLDTCILISDILNEKNPRIEKLKKDAVSHNIPCYISDSVQQETEKKIRETTDFLGNAVKDTILIHLEVSRENRKIAVTDPMTSGDIKALEELFSGFQSAVRTTSVALPHPLSLIEEWVVSYLSDKLDQGIPTTIMDFARELVKSVLKLTVGIQDSYDYLMTFEKGFVKKKNTPVDPRMVRIVANLEMLGIHPPDSDHVASAVMHQILTSEKAVFVTFDFGTILNKRDIIKTDQRIECCDPLYAVHHLI